MITFLEHYSPKYPGRTWENAGADCTIAIAVDFQTAGERLTKQYVETRKKIYIPLDALIIGPLTIKKLATRISDAKVKSINIAGNSLYTVQKIHPQFTQQVIDKTVYNMLHMVFNHPAFDANILMIQSGGQSGFDEAGLKAAELLGIHSLCVAPKGWMYLDGDGNTICDEKQFKSRFDNIKVY